MKRTRFTKTQIVKALKDLNGRRAAEDISREMDISKATLYRGKEKYSGMDSSDVKRLKESEEKNARLKRMYAELSLDHSVLKNVSTRRVWGSAGKES